MAKCFVLKTKSSYGKIPKGYTIQVVTSYSKPCHGEMVAAFIKEGFPEGDARHMSDSGLTKFDVISQA